MYRCKHCFRQFTTNSLKLEPKRKPYPKCPICGRATYLHHEYLYYSNFTCGNNKCRHSIKVIKQNAIDSISSEVLKDTSALKRLRTPSNLIIHELYMYFACNSSTRAISNFFYDRFDYKVPHVSIHKWTRKFAPLFKEIMERYLPDNLNLSDEWHADETVVKIGGQRHYIWTIIDSETRYVMAWHLTKSREATEAYALFNYAKKRFGAPKSIVTDRLPSYNMAVKTVFNESEHIKVQSYSDDITNNLLESFFSKFKANYKASRGLKTFDSSNSILMSFFYFYNYIRPHGSLSDQPPARVAGLNYSELARKNLLLAS